MKKIGIIAEYNPFHNGHLYQIEQIKALYPDSLIVVVLGGNFLQRGIPSVIDKWKKTEIALEYVDLVIELPFPFATQSADIFAKGSIQILKELDVDYLCFGSESSNLEILKTLADTQLNNETLDKKVQCYLDKGLNYPTALAKALKEITGYQVSTPNDLLGISYLKELRKQNTKIKPLIIKRTNDYHSTNLETSITSATSIRDALKENKDISSYVPAPTLAHLKTKVSEEDYFKLLKYKIMTSPDLSIYQTVDEGIEIRLKKMIFISNSLEELIQNIKTKRYTYNKISRMLTHILCCFTKEEALEYQDVSYLRILGFNHKGKVYLKEVKQKSKLPIISKFKKDEKMLQLELRVTSVYASILKPNKQNEIINAEYQKSPISK